MGSTKHENDLATMGYDFSGHNLYSACESYNDILNVDKFDELGGVYNYAQKYANIDVSLAPLAVNSFNECKSNLKIIEAGMKKKAIICTGWGPYVYDHKLIGYVETVSPGKSWLDVISNMTKKRAIEMGNELHNYIKKTYDIRVVNKKRRDVYKRIIAK
jgi:hypothetical protein